MKGGGQVKPLGKKYQMQLRLRIFAQQEEEQRQAADEADHAQGQPGGDAVGFRAVIAPFALAGVFPAIKVLAIRTDLSGESVAYDTLRRAVVIEVNGLHLRP